jgi:hypothetical protein
MKKVIFSVIVTVFCTAAFAQEEGESGSSTRLKKSDRVVFDIFYDMWQDAPANIGFKSIQPGFAYTSFQDFPLGNSNFSIALGVGISVHNMHTDALLTLDTAGNTEFMTIPASVTFGGETKDISYKINKLTLSYIETPLEFRFRTKSVYPFKIYAGFKLGILLQEHTKYVGDDFITGSENEIKFKEYKHQNFETLRYGPTIRIAYRWISLYGSYNMTPVFEKDKGPQMYPISVGLSLMPY